MLFKRKNNRDVVDLYEAIIEQSRQPVLYTDYGVEDTPVGRFQMIALHAAPYFVRAFHADESDDLQGLFNLIFKDIEFSFREIGVGDLAVPKKMKIYMQLFNGQMQAHCEDKADHVAIVERNVFDNKHTINTAFKNYIKGLFHESSK